MAAAGDLAEEKSWYAVRCVFHWDAWEGTPYEERLTLWQAASMDEAIARAESEARTYAGEWGHRYLELAQCYRLATAGRPGDGAEVFSLLRDSLLGEEAYLDHFFDTGQEHQGTTTEG
ncbi:hypothetical protein ABUW04_11815 [Streptacidiphilus sp. N1-10]|uniref:DUF4288 domain-containing protein n=1 Tax=Streptacidiphilus jeojiensis TaxID=3229225 RepID=A0ABV6XL08_9ACTN